MTNQTKLEMPEQTTQASPVSLAFQPAEIEGTIQARFERVAAAFPTRMALSGTTYYRYGELNEAANRLAHALANHIGARGDEPVALLLNHDPQSIVAMLGVLKAGKVYVSLSPSDPQIRLRNLLDNIGARLLITNTQHGTLAAELMQPTGDVLNLDEIPSNTPAFNPPCHTRATAPAAIAFTSGSTGTPKGIIQNHRTTLQRAWKRATYNNFGMPVRSALIHAYNFAETWGTLLHGATLVFYDMQHQGGINLAQWLVDEKITNLHIPIDLYRQLLDTLPADAYFPDLHVIEPLGRLYRHDVERSWPYLPPQAVITCRFATTETGRVTIFVMNRTTPLTTNIIPAGYAMSDIEVVLLTEAGQPAAAGEDGQIYVRSQYLPSGYWQDPALTQQVYQVDPERPGWRICCTGDWGRLQGDGMLEFIGRRDARVKIRGHRIDLGEIEAALYQLPTIRGVVVVAQPDPTGEQRLVAYYVPAPAAKPTSTTLRTALAQTLPSSMIPALFMPLATLPLLPNGKVDRKALPVPEQHLQWARPELAAPYGAPSTPLEEKLVAIWEEVLGIQPVGVHDPFLELGGNSLRAMQIHARLLDQLQIDLAASTLFRCATIAAMALAILQEQTDYSQESAITALLDALGELSGPAAIQQLDEQAGTRNR